MAPPFPVLLVGAGAQGWESRGPSIQALAADGVILSAIADPDPVQREWSARRLGVAQQYASMSEALAHDVFDGVVLAVPNGLREPLTLEALAAGCHVLCEKPMALNVAGAQRMVDAAAAADKTLVIGYQYPWMHPGLFDLTQSGALDAVFRVDGHWTRADGIPPEESFSGEPTAGAAGDLLGHMLSVVRVGLRARPESVTALSWNQFGRRTYGDAFRGHDTLETFITFEGGAAAHFVVAWAMNTDVEESIGVAFHGRDTSVTVPLIGRSLDVAACRPIVHRKVGTARVDGLLTHPLPVQTEEAYVLQARDWVEAARTGTPPRFGPHDARDIQGILDAAVASARDGGRPVAVNEMAAPCR